MPLIFWPAGYPANLKLDTGVTGYWNSGCFLYRQQIFFGKTTAHLLFPVYARKFLASVLVSGLPGPYTG